MRVMVLVEDRDTAYLFLDIDNAPAESVLFDLVLEGVPFERIGSEDDAIWLMTGPDTLVVRPREGYDFSRCSESEMPIPTPLICMTTACMEVLVAEWED